MTRRLLAWYSSRCNHIATACSSRLSSLSDQISGCDNVTEVKADVRSS